MSHRRAKRIRKSLRERGISISAEPYRLLGSIIIASRGRRIYQELKERGIVK